jgi:hypothetical protein
MAILSEGLIPQKISPLIIKDFVEKITYVQNVKIRTFDNHATISFLIKDALHGLWVFNDEDPENEFCAGEETVVNLYARGEGPRIVREIMEYFGGLYTANDHVGEWERFNAIRSDATPATFEIELYGDR